MFRGVKRFMLVTGPESSGSSCVAGILYHLGINMGKDLKGPTAANPKGYFEDNSFLSFFGYPDFWANPKTYIEQWAKTRLAEESAIWGVKQMQITNENLGIILFEILKELAPAMDIRIIRTLRDQKCIIRSVCVKRPARDPEGVAKDVMDGLVIIDRKFLEWKEKFGFPVLEMHYDWMIENTASETNRLVRFCFDEMRKPTKKTINEAILFVDPILRHWT